MLWLWDTATKYSSKGGGIEVVLVVVVGTLPTTLVSHKVLFHIWIQAQIRDISRINQQKYSKLFM